MRAVLDDDRARSSPLYGRVVFLLASPESGADLFARVLTALPGVVRAPVPTHVFSQGVATMVKYWHYEGVDAHQGLDHFLDQQDFLFAVRALVDEVLLRAVVDGDLVVEYSYGHIHFTGILRDLYPDAQFIHVVRDGRLVVSRLTSRPYDWPVEDAVAVWRGDQESVGVDPPVPRLEVIRYEDLLANPAGTVRRLVDTLELELLPEVIDAAAALVRGEREAPPPRVDAEASATAERLASDTLQQFAYTEKGCA